MRLPISVYVLAGIVLVELGGWFALAVWLHSQYVTGVAIHVIWRPILLFVLVGAGGGALAHNITSALKRG